MKKKLIITIAIILSFMCGIIESQAGDSTSLGFVATPSLTATTSSGGSGSGAGIVNLRTGKIWDGSEVCNEHITNVINKTSWIGSKNSFVVRGAGYTYAQGQWGTWQVSAKNGETLYKVTICIKSSNGYIQTKITRVNLYGGSPLARWNDHGNTGTPDPLNTFNISTGWVNGIATLRESIVFLVAGQNNQTVHPVNNLKSDFRSFCVVTGCFDMFDANHFYQHLYIENATTLTNRSGYSYTTYTYSWKEIATP